MHTDSRSLVHLLSVTQRESEQKALMCGEGGGGGGGGVVHKLFFAASSTPKNTCLEEETTGLPQRRKTGPRMTVHTVRLI